MATAVVGLRYRQSWEPVSGTGDRGTSRPHRPDSIMGLDRLHAMSDLNGNIDHNSSRPRLPSISNFLQGTAPQDLNLGPQDDSPVFSNRLPPARPISSPSMSHNPWSAQEDLRQKSQFDQRPSFHARSTSDLRLSSPESTHMSSVVLPQIAMSDTHASSPLNSAGLNTINISPRTTAKRVVGEEVVMGKGLCYVYDDGTVCQKVINGDTVNPKWGTTKAGKPRKRLGQACNTCREKKIKCDPSFPKCTQCQKFNRECRFDPTTRSSQKSPMMRATVVSPSDHHGADESGHHRRLSTAPTDVSSLSGSCLNSSPRRKYSEDDQNSTPSESLHLKTERIPQAKRARPTESPADYSFPPAKYSSENLLVGQSLPPRRPFSLTIDPYAVDKTLTRTCLDIYFTHSVALKHNLVPYRTFVDWVESDHQKSQESILVIYAMLAWACCLEGNNERTKWGTVFSDLVLEGVSQMVEQFSIQHIQARAIFTMHQFQIGNFERAWELCGSALRMASAMRLYSEDGIEARCRESPDVYNFDPPRLAETMRRSFWCIYQLDLIGVSCLGWGSPFDKREICLRIPCTEGAFSTGQIHQCQIYDGEVGLLTSPSDDSTFAHVTLLRRMQILSLLGEVRHLAMKSRLQTLVNRSERTAAKRRSLEQELANWNQWYISDLRKDQSSIPSASSKESSEIGGLHIMYHHACMGLHRHIHHASLTHDELAKHIQASYYHACETLKIAQLFVSHGNKNIYDYHIAAEDPTTAYAILTAIDIITSAGSISEMLEDKSRLMTLILPGIELSDRIARRWVSAKHQQESLSERLAFLLRSAQGGVATGKVAFYITEPMATSFGSENDVVYGVDRHRYLRIRGLIDHSTAPSEILSVYTRQEP